MDEFERKIKIKELMEIRNQLINNEKIDFNQDNGNQNNERAKVRTKSNGKVTGIIEQPQVYTPFDKTGMVNIVTLSIITFVFECVFLFLSFMIFK